MALKAVASLKNIKDLGIETVSAKKTDSREKYDPKPVMSKKINFEEVLEQFSSLTDVLFGTRLGEAYPFSAMGSALVKSLAADIKFSSSKSIHSGKVALLALEEICLKAGAGRVSNCHATRTRRIIEIMNETPYMEDDHYARLVIVDDKTVLEECERRDASTVLEVFEEINGKVPYEFLYKLETAKTNRVDALRRIEMKIMRGNTPDFGICMIPAVLSYNNFNKAGMPVTDIVRTNYPTISWLTAILNDLLAVLNSAELEVFVPFIDNIDEYAELYKHVMSVKNDDGDPMIKRQRVKALYEQNPSFYDEVRIKFKEAQDELTAIQQEAVGIVNDILELVTVKKAEKDWYRALDQRNNPEKYANTNNSSVSHATPVIDSSTPVEITSTATPDEAFASLGADVDVEIGIPRFNAAALGFSELERKEALGAIGLDGPRACEAYPGVIWEAVVGPIDHAMDLSRKEVDCRMVVIAPRRVGGMGVDMNQVRVLLVDDYEAYFSKV